jgi:hypothetical protein
MPLTVNDLLNKLTNFLELGILKGTDKIGYMDIESGDLTICDGSDIFEWDDEFPDCTSIVNYPRKKNERRELYLWRF